MTIGNSLRVYMANVEDFSGESANARLDLIALEGDQQRKLIQLTGKKPLGRKRSGRMFCRHMGG